MAEPYIIKMPQLSDTMTEGVLVSWEKEIGEFIERGTVVATVETDKAIMDVEVFREGYLSGPQLPIGGVAAVGEPIAYLVAEAEQVVSTEASASSKPAPEVEQKPGFEPAGTSKPKTKIPAMPEGATPAPHPGHARATPYARQLAGAHGIDLSGIKGSGPEGAIVAADVVSGESARGVTRRIFKIPGEGRPMDSMEKAIAHNMEYSLSMPLFRATVYVDSSRLVAAAKAQGSSVTVAAAKAAALAIAEHPRINSVYQHEDRILEREQIDVGLAVATEGMGLVVPVLRDAFNRGLAALNASWIDLVERARIKRLKPEEYSNPTFIISNMGMLGVAYFDAIPSPGTSAILAIATAGPQGMPVTITADHRIINGADAARFLNTFKERMEHPEAWIKGGSGALPTAREKPVTPPLPLEGDWDYDVVVIGGGPGGEDCARELTEHGIKVALINDSPFPGGECLWRGCIPSKTWRAAADRIRDRAHDSYLGVGSTTPTALDWNALEKTRRHILQSRGEMALKTDTAMKIKFIQGHVRFADEHHIVVDTAGNSDDPFTRAQPQSDSQSQTLSFAGAVIATGAPPFIPPIPGAQEGVAAGGVVTSDTIWGLERTPKRLAVIGGGAIGVEMAQIFQDFGTDVVLLEAQERLLAEVEPEVGKLLAEILNADPRLTVHTSAKVQEIKGHPGAMQVAFNDAEGGSHHREVDYVLMATGKRPHLEPLALDKAGVTTEKDVIQVNAQCVTSKSHIFAVGDVIGGLMLAHTAGQQGRVAAATILGEPHAYKVEKDCGVIFTRPQAAFVGLSVAQAREQGIDAVEMKTPIRIDAKAMINNETEGFIKLVADKASHRIIGAHFLVDHADTLIGEAVMMVSGEMTLKQVARAIHPHPTQTELFGEMARRLLSRLRRTQRR